VRFFESDLTPHFKAEEEVLFPSMRGFVGASDLLGDLLREHRDLERLAARLAGTEISELAAALNEFADLLERHIRKEERQLFPLYESQTWTELSAEVQRAIKHVIGDALKPKSLELLR
jgi:hemerythrin-like domain-containing protein